MAKMELIDTETGQPVPAVAGERAGQADEQDRTAYEYDTWIVKRDLISKWMRFLMSPAAVFFHNTQAWKLAPALQIRPQDRVLDIGCGYGSLLIYLHQRVRFRTPAEGIDVSPHMLEHAEREIGKRGLHGVIHVRQGKATALPYEDETFDIALSTYMIKHLSDESLLRMLKEVRRVLKPGGRFCFWEVGPSRVQLLTSVYKQILSGEVSTTNLRSAGKLSELMRNAGFESVTPFARGFYFLCPTMPRVGFIATKG